MDRMRKAVSIVVAALALVPAGSAFARRPAFHHQHRDRDSDEQEFRNKRGARPVKTHVGTLTLHSRSLLGKDGKTSVEVSTAPFDVGATPAGNISDVEIWAADPNRPDERGRGTAFHKQYEHLRQGGYVQWTYPGLPHGQPLRFKVKARSDSFFRDDTEAKWLDYVKYRPDLVVQNVEAPGMASLNSMVQITAAVVEQKGDLGAYADCVLLIDGAQVDIVPPIWVAANGSAGCVFTTSFKTGGQHSITVRAQNVRPGDYDDSNNSFTRQIQIQVQSAGTLYYDLAVMDQTQSCTTTMDSYYTSTAVMADAHSVQTSNNYVQERLLSGTIPAAVGTVKRLAYSDSSGGKALSSVSFDNPSFIDVPVDDNCDPSSTKESMFNDFDGATGRAFTVLRCFNSNTNSGTTIISVAWNAFDDTFYSVNTCNTAGMGCTPGDFTTGEIDGARVQFDGDYSASFTLDDGTVYNVTPTMALPIVAGSSAPASTSSCTATDFHTGTMGKVCTQIDSLNYTRQGEVAVVPSN
jgi:hypothetical protein